ncbi:polyprenyl synthetase family protein [Alkalibacter sp. M17DMB]|nr:polyprenyl synthetase family protein [Alkalibacter mobilis]
MQLYLFELRDTVPKVLYDSMEYSLMAGGKRLRPILTMEFAGTKAKNHELALPLACAIEMIHTYSLIHDDLPPMDNDSLRRGKPTNHILYGENVAILSGDALLNYSFEIMLQNIPLRENEGYLKAMGIIANGAGPRGMIGGQVDDIKNESSDLTIEELESINNRKTGALLKSSVLAGAVYAKLEHNKIQLLERYSDLIGLAFQIVDDILDISGDASITGKETGKDTENNKITYPMVYGMEKSKKIVDDLYTEAIECLKKAEVENEFLIDLTGFICNRDY